MYAFCHSLYCDLSSDYLSSAFSLLGLLLGFVSLFCFESLYLSNCGLDFDESWWKCWNLGPIDFMFSDDVIMASFLIVWLYCKGREFCGKGKTNY